MEMQETTESEDFKFYQLSCLLQLEFGKFIDELKFKRQERSLLISGNQKITKEIFQFQKTIKDSLKMNIENPLEEEFSIQGCNVN